MEGNGDLLMSERGMGGGGEEDVTLVTWRERVGGVFRSFVFIDMISK